MTADVAAVMAVGVNCTAPGAVRPSIAAAATAGKPVVVYPNSGEGWDAVGRRWTGAAGITRTTSPAGSRPAPA